MNCFTELGVLLIPLLNNANKHSSAGLLNMQEPFPIYVFVF